MITDLNILLILFFDFHFEPKGFQLKQYNNLK